MNRSAYRLSHWNMCLVKDLLGLWLLRWQDVDFGWTRLMVVMVVLLRFMRVLSLYLLLLRLVMMMLRFFDRTSLLLMMMMMLFRLRMAML